MSEAILYITSGDLHFPFPTSLIQSTCNSFLENHERVFKTENATQTINMLGVVAEFQAQQSIQKGFCFIEDCDKQVKRIKYPG